MFFFTAFDGINRFFEHCNAIVGGIFFFDLAPLSSINLPFVVVWLVVGATFFTFYFRFINVRGFKHAIDITRGHYDDPDSEGQVSHFMALTTALSATVGLGNIAGVAIAISLGGPGATFWMIMAGLLGMNSKFTECALATIYRKVRPDGQIMGGPMEYLKTGLAEVGWPRLGKGLSVLFAILCIGGSFGGGSSFQVNQALNAITETLPGLAHYNWLFGIIMAAGVGIVIIGGIQRIAQVAEKVVPLMCGIYLFSALIVLGAHLGEIPGAFASIVSGAFSPDAAYGGFVGVLVTGFKRAAFSNEAGVGSAAIAHAAAKTHYPVQEGIVALLEPFIDTVVICTITALVIVITGAHVNPDYQTLVQAQAGAALTSRAMGEVLPWFPYILSISVLLFAFSTIISWSYYGERCFTYLCGEKYSIVYKILLLIVVFLGAVTSSTTVLEFGDLMILGMAFPNILGLYFLAPKLKGILNKYWSDLQSGKIKKTKA